MTKSKIGSTKQKGAELKAEVIRLYKEGLSGRDIAKRLPICRSTIQKVVVEAGISRTRSEALIGNRSGTWKGGKVKHGKYIWIYMPEHPSANKRRYISEHRLVMEKKLGRYLLRA